MSKKKVTVKTRKISGVKTRNHLRNKGRLKIKKHTSPFNQFPKEKNSTASVTEEEIDFIDERYETVQNEFNSLEDRYENTPSVYQRDYNTKMLLPIKTKKGFECRFTEVKDTPESKDGEEKDESELPYNPVPLTLLEADSELSVMRIDTKEPVSMAKIYAKREEAVQKYKFRIGFLSCTLLENPEQKIGNLSSLLEIMDEKGLGSQVTIKKLVVISLMEIFKDLIPAYQIKHQNVSLKKLKKITQQLMGYENQLLKSYQIFLIRLEKMAENLKKKKGNSQIVPLQEKNLAKLAVKCLCELLLAQPYFNFGENIVHFLTMYLDNSDEDVRKTVEDCYKKIFHDDKRGFISLVIVRRINHLVKTRANSVHCEVLTVLLALRFKNVNLDEEKEYEIQNKKLENKKSRLINLSKRERKRKNELKKIENEMLEASAEESRKSKKQHLTEIVKVVFLIYFRILKRTPRSNLLSVTLEGFAKFAHCINLEYYQDLVNVLNHLLENKLLNVREQLCCIKTVFIILSNQSDVLNVDPLSFYTHLYRIMLNVHAGKTYENADLLCSTLEAMLIKKRKTITTQRMLSFTKRLATLALQLLHNGSLGSLSILKSILQLSKAADVLLDVESACGQGVYNAEIHEPEYCNAGCTALWELCALRRHYHPIVKKMSTYVVSNGASTMSEGNLSAYFAKMTCSKFFHEYDPSQVAFNPSIPPPKKKKNARNSL